MLSAPPSALPGAVSQVADTVHHPNISRMGSGPEGLLTATLLKRPTQGGPLLFCVATVDQKGATDWWGCGSVESDKEGRSQNEPWQNKVTKEESLMRQRRAGSREGRGGQIGKER